MEIKSVNKINPLRANININFASKKKCVYSISNKKTLDKKTINETPFLTTINNPRDEFISKNTTSDRQLKTKANSTCNPIHSDSLSLTDSKKILSAKDGYNKIACHYDTWKWQKFWEENEMPLIIKWSENKKNSFGADIGVGTGRNLKIFLNNNNQIDGFDISDEMITICKQKYSDYIDKGRLNCYNLSIFDIINSNHKYDWLISNRVMSNIEDLEKFIQALQKIIKVGGECFISDVHPERNYDYTHMNIDNKDIYIETYKHSISQIKQLFERYNFEILKYEEFTKDKLKLTNTITTDTKPIFYYFILKYKGKHR